MVGNHIEKCRFPDTADNSIPLLKPSFYIQTILLPKHLIDTFDFLINNQYVVLNKKPYLKGT